ncbi:hypothetical protein [Nocardia transvalensis]|uniref:hypothetical protein n=1 Tax=Nocardia transvalensis TaxID=37333 RepID=UPI00189354C8|nr:hypothetical protein [Nocardia transvalensis]MBF6333590.1 hypothetical protein [Nocardia transvalensis]
MPITKMRTPVIPEPDHFRTVEEAGRTLLSARVADGRQVVFDYGTDGRVHLDFAPDGFTGVGHLNAALTTGASCGGSVALTAVGGCDGTIADIEVTGGPEDIAALKEAVEHFNSVTRDPRQRAAFRKIYRHLAKLTAGGRSVTAEAGHP